MSQELADKLKAIHDGLTATIEQELADHLSYDKREYLARSFKKICLSLLDETAQRAEQNVTTALAQEAEREPQQPVDPPLRTDGPTLSEYIAAGHKAETYPPAGYAAKPEPPPPAVAKVIAEPVKPAAPPVEAQPGSLKASQAFQQSQQPPAEQTAVENPAPGQPVAGDGTDQGHTA